MSETNYKGTNRKSSYTILTGTAAEVLQQLADAGVNREQIVVMASDATSCVYSRK